MKKEAQSHERLLQALCVVLQEERKTIGITQMDVAQRAGMQRSYISDVEQGARNLSVKNLCRIASALEMQLSDVVDRAEEKSSSRKRRARA